ncbi:MAG: outer membrane beta-barrel protein [Verrucomicrobiae bacterium]|nr:outer membrane beta-barrel protein [Verrucomicrobiae bacterium]
MITKRSFSAFILAAASVAGLGGAQAQGLLSIGADNDFEANLPFTVTLATAVGYDSNSNQAPDGFDEADTGFWQGGVVVAYASGSPVTKVKVGGQYSGFYYFDTQPNQDDWFHNFRATLNVTHSASRRLQLGFNGWVAYEFQPDFAIGQTSSRVRDQYTFGYANFSAAYMISPAITSVTNYTFNGVYYDEDNADDRVSHLISQQFKYLVSRLTALTAEYRFGITEYDSGRNDYKSHYALIGANHAFSRQLTASIAGGAEFTEFDSGGDTTNPYFEGALNYRLAEETTLRWYNRYGYDATNAGTHQKRLSYRTGLTATQKFGPYLSGNAGVHYIHQTFENGFAASDRDDDVVYLTVGLDYQILDNVVLNSSYSYTNLSSDAELLEYDRSRVSLGVSATF